MPTVIDATVVNSAYDTSGNGGRKLVRLSNGWLVAGTKASGVCNFYKSTDNGNTWQPLCSISFGGSSPLNDFAIDSVGTKIYFVGTFNGVIPFAQTMWFDATAVTNENIINNPAYNSNRVQYDSSATTFGNCSIAINSSKTEIHAVWSAKTSLYPNSFNIRYVKGTINGDGSVTWGSVEQVTNVNYAGNDYKNPCVVVYNNTPLIIFENVYNTNIYSIGVAGKTIGSDGNYFPVSPWNARKIYLVSGYPQSSPSACVDKNGRIWVAWMGQDSTDNTMNNIRVAYSDDGGVTWSAMTKLTSGNTLAQAFPSITVDKNNNVYVVWSGYIASGDIRVRLIKYTGGSWGTITNLTTTATNNHRYPSALFDNTLGFTTPLFIYKDDTKVGFYGTWIVTTISVPQGHIGQKTSADKNNILTYSIATEDAMGTITEKINGTTIATRTNPTNGQQFTVSLTQEQWDAIPYGKYAYRNLLPKLSQWTSLAAQATIVSDYELRLNATDINQSSYINIPCQPNTQYTFSVEMTGGGYFNIITYDAGMTQITNHGITQNGSRTFTTESNAKYIRVVLSNFTLGAGTYTFKNPMLNEGATAKPFVPFGAENTLTIEMGDETWTYTFDKRLNENDDILSAIKAAQDLQTTFLPAIKAQLGAMIRAKGGTVNDTDPWSTFINVVAGLSYTGAKRWATGTATRSASTLPFTLDSGSTNNSYYITVTGLTFTPRTIIVFGRDGLSNDTLNVIYSDDSPGPNRYIQFGYYGGSSKYQLTGNAYINSSSFQLPVSSQSSQFTAYWVAFE